MRTLLKRLFLFLGISGILLIMAGCNLKVSLGGSGDTETTREIEKSINSFKAAVEAYDVEGMLSFLEENPPEDPLTIVEGNDRYDKTYETLKTELEEDAPYQLTWRKPSTEEGGWGYTLTMQLGTVIFTRLGTSGANVVVPFSIIEASEKLSHEAETDRGHMVYSMVKLQGTWRCRHMTIHFNPAGNTGSASINSVGPASSQVISKARYNKKRAKGFGLGDPEAFIETTGHK